MASATSYSPRGESTSSVFTASNASTTATTLASEQKLSEQQRLGQESFDPVHHFTTCDEIFDLVDRTEGDYLVVKDVSPQNLEDIDAEREIRHRKFRLRRYYLLGGTLIISIPHGSHERLHRELYKGLILKLGSMGLAYDWAEKGGASFRGAGYPAGGMGEGDSSGGPEWARGMSEDWPTLVIEAGFSQSILSLRRDMHWWFEASDHAVKIVLLVKLNRDHRQFLIEKYEEESVVRPGATATRATAISALTPVLRQSISITENFQTVPLSYDVARGALELDFRLLFLRDPGPGEGNVVFSIRELQVFASKHIHLDKAYLLTSNHPPSDTIRSYDDLALLTGSFEEALGKSYDAKHRYTAQDLYLRGRQLVADCFRHGVTSMRAFVEVDLVTQLKTLEAAVRLKREFAHLVRVQICVFAQGPLFSGKVGLCNKRVLSRALDEYAGDIEALGTTPYVEADEGAAMDNIRWAIENAMARKLFLDFHLDYHLRSSAGAGAMMIQSVLELLVKMDWTTKASKSRQAIAIGHCTRLTTLEAPELREIVDQINEFKLPVHFVGLPTSDLLMMGRPLAGGGDTGSDCPFSRPRGTLQVVSMITDWGLNACIGVNNVGNPFTPHGNGDPLQLACWGVGLYHAGTADDAELLYQCVSDRAMRAIGLEPGETPEGREIRGLGGVPYPGLLIENPEFDRLPGPADEDILVPARRRLGVKDVVWDPPVSRRVVRYDSEPSPPDGKRRPDGTGSAEEVPAKKVDTKTEDAAASSLMGDDIM